MLKKLVVAAALGVFVSSAASAQFSVGARVGTLGIGAEAGFEVNPNFSFIGGWGSTAYHYDGDFDGKTVTLDTPPSIWNLGVQFAPSGGAFHFIAGVLHRPQFDLTGKYTGSTQVGNNTYNGTVSLTGNVKNDREIGPYLGIGFGKMTKRGFGVSFDLGAGMLGEGKVNLTSATCTLSSGSPCPNQSQFQSDVQAEAKKMTDDIGSYVKWHPIASLSFHYGFGQ